ncbi:MAG: ABC transporter ATP-binding protein [Pseudomonadota bacterium]
MQSIVSIKELTKTYGSSFEALKGVDLEIAEGEIIALLGPNGAGKTTLISTICGITSPTSGAVTVGGHDIIDDFRAARAMIGLVPQEIALEPFNKVWNTVSFTRGLFGKPRNDAYIEHILRQLSLWDKKDSQIMALSGGMKRRVLIAKALSHEPRVLFLDEPTAGVDVELRRDMWETVERLRAEGVTIILTTHYIEEAEAIADRVAVINEGRILLVEEKSALMQRMGRKELQVELLHPVSVLPDSLAQHDLQIAEGGNALRYAYDTTGHGTGITGLLADLSAAGLQMRDLSTRQSTLEDIFVDLLRDGVKEPGTAGAAPVPEHAAQEGSA